MKRDERHPLDFRAGLKIKIKSLAEEARTIRKMEKAARSEKIRVRLYYLRVGRVRQDARETLLAYAFIRRKAYRGLERSFRFQYGAIDWKRVALMVHTHTVGGYGNNSWEECIAKLRVDLSAWTGGLNQC
jgi:hypothetical protein